MCVCVFLCVSVCFCVCVCVCVCVCDPWLFCLVFIWCCFEVAELLHGRHQDWGGWCHEQGQGCPQRCQQVLKKLLKCCTTVVTVVTRLCIYFMCASLGSQIWSLISSAAQLCFYFYIFLPDDCSLLFAIWVPHDCYIFRISLAHVTEQYFGFCSKTYISIGGLRVKQGLRRNHEANFMVMMIMMIMMIKMTMMWGIEFGICFVDRVCWYKWLHFEVFFCWWHFWVASSRIVLLGIGVLNWIV